MTQELTAAMSKSRSLRGGVRIRGGNHQPPLAKIEEIFPIVLFAGRLLSSTEHQDRIGSCGAERRYQPGQTEDPVIIVADVNKFPERFERATGSRSREGLHSFGPAESDRWVRHHPPSIHADFDHFPRRIAKVKIDSTAMFGNTD